MKCQRERKVKIRADGHGEDGVGSEEEGVAGAKQDSTSMIENNLSPPRCDCIALADKAWLCAPGLSLCIRLRQCPP